METDDRALNFLLNPENHYLGKCSELKLAKPNPLSKEDIFLYHIEELTFEDKAPRKEAFENVISSMRVEGVSFLYLILGTKKGVHFYFGIVRNTEETSPLPLTVGDIGEMILEPSIRGNFRGSKIKAVSTQQKENILKRINDQQYFAYLEGVPGVHEDGEAFQGVDRLTDVMLGDEFGLAIIAKPLSQGQISQVESNLYAAYYELFPFAKQTTQKDQGFSNTTESRTTKDNSITHVESSSQTRVTCESDSDDVSNSSQRGSMSSKQTCTNQSESTRGRPTEVSTQTTDQGSEGTSATTIKRKCNSTSIEDNRSKGVSQNYGDSATDATNQSKVESTQTSIQFVRKDAQDWISYLEEVVFPRLDYGKGRGIFVSTVFLFSTNKGNLIKLGNTVKSLYSGKKGNKVPLKLNLLQPNGLLNYLKSFQIPTRQSNGIDTKELWARTAISQYCNDDKLYYGSWLSSNELSLIAGLPQKEVVGLALKEEVEFGLNFNNHLTQERQIPLGNLIQSGRELKDISVYLDKDTLSRHVFVTGVTGSGKTTTCHKLLIDSDLPFIVIEPAKTEYRILTERYEDLLIFTLGKDTVAPFRLNPFEFFPHESITSRVDMIKASLEAAFHMEAAIPQILEKAIYEAYTDFGWNIASNKNELYKDPFAEGVYAFPTMEDLIKKAEAVVRDQGFDERLRDDYIGSIRARLQGLLVGAKGLMLNTKRSVDFENLLNRRVVLELEEIRSGSEKSLIMGFVLTNLIEAIKARFLKTGEFKHITLIEEAHRLLSKYHPGDSLNKKQGVEVFTDMLAEVRKYGESLIIVDQIPDKLTSEVLKNTNTKIVHKIFAKDDKEAIGNTMALNEEQKEFMSNLEVGRAIVFTQGWSKALQVQIGQVTYTTGRELVSDEKIRFNIMKFYQQCYKRGVIQGLELFEQPPDINEVQKFIDFVQGEALVEEFKRFISEGATTYDFKSKLEQLLAVYSLEFLTGYISKALVPRTTEGKYSYYSEQIDNLIQEILEGKITRDLGKFEDKFDNKGMCL